MSRVRRRKKCWRAAALALVTLAAFAAAGDTGTSMGDRSGEGATPFTGLAQAPEANLFTGALTTRIPIAIPPGRKGMTPELALEYSSAGGPGPFGHGWDLPIGRVERSTKWGVPRCTGDHIDDFVLVMPGSGAVELVRNSPAGNVFRPVVEASWLEAVFDAGANRWTVRDLSGMRYTFGDQSSARVSTSMNGPALAQNPDGSCDLTSAWMLTAIEDTNGNSVEIEWLLSQNVPLPSRVLYGGNSNGIEHFYRVQFHYLLRPPTDFLISHRLGVEQRSVMRLQVVSVYSDVPAANTAVRSYEFHYFDDGVTHSMLNAVAASDEPTQTFVYTPSGMGHATPAQAIAVPVPPDHTFMRAWTSSLEVHYSIIDMNGDGRLDLVKGGWFPWTVHFGESDGGEEFQFSESPVQWSGNSNYSEGRIRNVWITTGPCNDNGWACTTVDTFDITGDGRVDYVVATDAGQPWRVHTGERKSDGNWGFSQNPILWPAPDRFIRRTKNGHTYRDTIDLNGDGLPDLVDIVNGEWRVWINHGLGFETEPLPAFPAPVESIGHQSGGSSGSTEYMLTDFDGDGLADMLQHVNAGDDDRCNNFPSSGGQTVYRHDCLLVFRNTGQGFRDDADVMPLPLWASGVTMQSGGEVIADMVDVNGDGLPDWVERSSDALSWKVLLNLGGTLTPASYSAAPPHDAVATTVWPGGQGPLRKISGRRTEIDLVDLNGDGFLDRVVAGDHVWDVQLNLLTQKPKVLWMMENGLGGTNTIVYEPTTRFDHTGGDEQPDMPFVSWVVAATRLNDGLCTPPSGANVFDRAENPCIDQGHEIVSLFDYQDGRLDLDYDYDANGVPIAVADRGFHGYRRVTRTDVDGNETATVFGQGPLVRGRLLELYYYAGDSDTGALVRYEINQWASRPVSGLRDQVWLDLNGRFTFDLGGTPHAVVTTNHSVDDYGNVLHTSVSGTEMPAVDTYTDYATPFGYNGSSPRNRPRQITTQTATGILDRRLFQYDGASLGVLSKGNLTAVLSWLDTDSRWITTAYGYDAYGNLVSTRDGKGVETSTSYDDGSGTYLYPFIETNGVGHSTVTVMDYRHGKPAAAWGANGMATATVFQYDAAGRPTCEVRPGDTMANCTVATTYEFAQGPGQHSKVTVARKQTGYASRRSTTTHFDALGRVRHVDVAAVVNGAAVTVRRDRAEYDAGGRVRERFYPYPATAAAPSNGSTSFDYRLNGSAFVDPLARVHRTTHADGSITRSLYQGARIASIDEEGNRTERVYDALERVVREEVYSGGGVYSSTRSKYDGMGRLIALHQNNDTLPMKSFSYDSLGRRVSVTDRDSGTWRYGYDDAGNLIYRDDPKVGQHTQYCYDAADRPVRACGLPQDFNVLYPCAQACNADETVYTYDEPAVPFSKGRLTTVADEAGSFRVLGYDRHGRQLATEREIDVDGAVTTGRFEYDYNDTDEVVQIRYPDGEVVTTTYDQAGQPIALQNGTGTVYVSAVWYDVFGRASSVWHGNGTRDDRSYYGAANRHRLSTVATAGSQGGFAFSQIYEYTPRGKIAAIYDFDSSSRSNAAMYEYDVLGRLTNFDSFQDPLDQSYQYDSRGNITRKGSLDFSYGNASAPATRPHQMLAVNGVAVTHDANGNRTRSHTGAQTYSYDSEDRLETVSLAGKNVDFLYDYSGERRARVVTSGSTTKVTRYYNDLLHTTATGSTVKAYYLGGMRVASQTHAGTAWETAAAGSGPVHVASGWQGRPFLILEVDSRIQFAAAIGTLLLFTVFVVAPGRRRRRVVGMRVRSGQAAALAIAFTITALPWPVIMRPAAAQCGGPPASAPIAHYHVDHLGSPQLVTNGSGAVVEHIRYMPFGELRGRWNGAGNPIAGPAVDQVTFDYTGHERELSSGLIYAKARFYDPITGTFLTPDPAGEFTSPYAYAGWDPVNGNDPTGEFVSIGLLLASFVIGFAIAAIDAAIAGAGLVDALKAGLIGGATSAISAAVLGPVNGAVAGLDGWARAAANAVRLAGGGVGIYNTVEAFRNGEYLAGSRGVLQIVSAAFGGLRESNAGVGAKESRMPIGFSLGPNTPAEPRGARMGPVADIFPARPATGTAATVRTASVTIFGLKVEVGTAWAIDSAGNKQMFDTFAVGFESEVLEISGVQGMHLTNANAVADLGGRSTTFGGTGGPSAFGFGAEYTVGPNYSGVTFYGGVQFGIAPVGAYGLRENWTPRGP